jgi:hypothetical protein
LQKQRPLAYRKFRFGTDPEKPWRFIFDAVVMISREPSDCRPFLARVTNKLPFVFANKTPRWRTDGFSKLRPALHTDKVFHQEKVIDLARIIMLKENRDE